MKNLINLFSVVLILLLMLIYESNAQCQPVKDQAQETFNLGTWGSDQWQSFTCGVSGNLEKIQLFHNGCQSMDFTLTIYSGNGTAGTVLFSQYYNFGYMCSQWFDINITPNSAPTLISGNIYTFRVQGNGTGFTSYNPGNYPSGDYYSNVYGQQNWDLTFRTYMSSADSTPPVAKTKNLNLYLDNSGQAILTPSMVDNDSYDNCGISNYWISRTNFSCSDLTNTTPNYALDFDGIDDRVVANFSTGLPQGSSDRTVEMWIKTTQTSVAAMFSFGNFAYLQRSGFYMISGRLYFVGEFNDVWGGSQVVNDNQWHHIAYTLSGQNIRFYIDGQFNFATTLPSVPQTTGTPWAMSNTSGYNGTREPYQGLMDELRVWSSVRTDTQIQSYYNQPLGGNEANLVSYYTFDAGSGNVVRDLTNNHNDGFLTNMDANTDWVAGAPPFGHVNRIKFEVTDFSGNRDAANALVTVIDEIPPTAVCKNVSVELDASGQAMISVGDVNNGSNDNCSIDSITVAPTNFTCADATKDLGDVNINNPVVRGYAGRTVTFHSVDINSSGNKIMVAPGSNITVSLSWFSQYTSTYCPGCIQQFYVGIKDVVNSCLYSGNTSSTRSGNRTFSFIAPTAPGVYYIQTKSSLQFSCINNLNFSDSDIDAIGAIIVAPVATLSVTDGSGNQSSCKSFVIVKDNIAPTVMTQNVTVELDGNGQATITANDVDNSSFDNCGIESLTVSENAFDCSDISSGSDGVLTSNLTVDNGFKYYISTDNNSNGTLLLTGNNWGTKYSNQTNLTQGQDYWLHIKAIDLGLIEMFIGDFSLTGSFQFENGLQTLGTNTANWKVSKTGFGQNEQTPRFVAFQGTHPWFSSGYLYGAYHIWESVWNTNGSETVYFSTKITATSTSNLVTLTATDPSGNSISKPARVIVKDNLPPAVITQNVTVELDANGQGTITANDVNNASTDNCGIESMSLDLTSFDCSNIGENEVTLSVTDVNGNTGSATAFVYVNDNVPPVVLTKNITVQLDASGNATITADDVNDGSNDNCSISETHVLPNMFDCSLQGQTVPVILTVIDGSGNASTGTANVTIIDNMAPTAVCKQINVYLDETGMSAITADDIDDGSYDNCSITSKGLSQFEFKCSNIGMNEVTLTVMDAAGNFGSCVGLVNVMDNMAPSVITQNVTIELDENGQATLTEIDVENGSTDNCGIVSLSVSPNTFGCNDVSVGSDGILKSNLTADNAFKYYISTDNSSNGTLLLTGNNWGAKYSNVTTLTQGQDYWLHIKAIDLGLIEMFIGDFQVTGSFQFDNGQQTLGTNTTNWRVSKTGFGQNEQAPIHAGFQGTHPWFSSGYLYGAYHIWDAVWNTSGNDIVYFSTKITSTSTSNLVYLTATDASGNSSSNTANVIVKDNLAPTVITQNVTVQLDANGNASVSASQIENGSYDNCGIAHMTLDISSFDCSNVGDNTVTLTVTDVNNNISTGTAVVTVEDNIGPTVITQNVTVQLDGDGNASVSASQIDNDSFDNCEIEMIALDLTSFDCSNVGENTVTLTVTDVSGNTSTGFAVVKVEDNSAPTVLTQNVTVQLDGDGNASVSASQIDNDSFDNCEIEMIALDLTSFDCSNVGENTVTLTVTDVNNNTSSGTAVVTIEDNIAPTVQTQNIIVELDEYGEVSITESQIDNVSYDNCGIYNLSLDITSFDCSNLGENTVTLTVTDVNGNSSSGQAVVTVEDNIAPTISVSLDPSSLWPPNHKMQTITANVTVDDNCASEGLNYELLSVTSNEPDNGLGDGDKPNDIQNTGYGTSDVSFDLRKERSGGGNGRIYTVTYKVTDASGNETTDVAYVTVPHDLGKIAEEFGDGNNSDIDFSNKQSVFVYPNPTSDFINFTYNSNVKGTVSYVLYDLLNHEINKGTFGNTDTFNEKIDLRSVPSGIYMLKIQSNDETQIIKIVKMK